MQSVGMPTFQQTFAQCPFPEGVLAVLGTYPVEVRVVKAERTMFVHAIGEQVAADVLEQAQAVLVKAFRLSRAEITVETPVEADGLHIHIDIQQLGGTAFNRKRTVDDIHILHLRVEAQILDTIFVSAGVIDFSGMDADCLTDAAAVRYRTGHDFIGHCNTS